MREALVLAGGFGTRLQAVVKDLPKPMASVNGVPFLTYILDELVSYGFDRVILSTGYMHERISQFFGNFYKGISLFYAVEETALGTGGGILNALQQAEAPYTFVLNGDTLFRADLDAFEQFHKSHFSSLSMILRKVPDVSRFGSVEIDETDRVIRFAEKNRVSGEGYINGGIYLLDKMLFDKYQPGTRFSFEKEVLEKQYLQNSFYAMSSSAYFIDIGIPEDYARAQRELIPKKS